MIHIKLLKEFIVSGAADLDAHTDAVMDELIKLENDHVRDADVSASLDECIVEISVVGIADTFDEAVVFADSAIRTAIHASGGSTQKWQRVDFTPQKSEADLLTA